MQTSFAKRDGSPRCGFTLTELCVVVVTLAILAAVALPALAGKDRVFSIRTQCANQLRQIGVGVTAYAHNNSGYVLSAWPNDWANPNDFNQYGIYIGGGLEAYDQHFVFPTQTNLLKLVYLAPSMTNNGVDTIWCCPSISAREAGLPLWSPSQKMLGIGYAYMGGITSWRYGAGNTPIKSLSPVNLGSSKPYWVLAADLVVDYGQGNWHIGNQNGSDIPHVRPGTHHPDGGNQLDADGSVAWAKLETMVNCNREAPICYDYIYQRNLIGDARGIIGGSQGNTFAAQVSNGNLSPQRLSAGDL